MTWLDLTVEQQDLLAELSKCGSVDLGYLVVPELNTLVSFGLVKVAEANPAWGHYRFATVSQQGVEIMEGRRAIQRLST